MKTLFLLLFAISIVSCEKVETKTEKKSTELVKYSFNIRNSYGYALERICYSADSMTIDSHGVLMGSLNGNGLSPIRSIDSYKPFIYLSVEYYGGNPFRLRNIKYALNEGIVNTLVLNEGTISGGEVYK